MKYKLDDDRRGFHIWLDDAEFQKLRADAHRAGEDNFDGYLSCMMLHHVFEAVASAVRSGLQSGIPKITITRVD